MAHQSTITGRVSELTVERELLRRGWQVSTPSLDEKYDILVREPGAPVHEYKRIQVKTIRRRDDRKNQMVVYATDGKGRPYTYEDCDFLIGVEGLDFYIIPCLGLTEYWAEDATYERKGWRKFSLTDE